MTGTIDVLGLEHIYLTVSSLLSDPDGIRLELSNFRKDRRERFEGWEELGG